MIQTILLAFFEVVNWAAFSTTHFQCRQTVSFLGIPRFTEVPSEESCRNAMKVIIGTIDLLLVLGLVMFAKRRFQGSRSGPPSTR